MKKKLFSIFLSLAIFLSVFSISTILAPSASAIYFETTSYTIVKDQQEYAPSVKGANTAIESPYTFTYTSNNTSVATVSSAGVITGKANGTATITAKSSAGNTCSMTVYVKAYSSIVRTRGTTSPIGTHYWSIKGNKLVVTSSRVTGTGYITTFSDTTGENSNTLKAGDVATRGDKDNPAHGTAVTVTANGITRTMYKRDNGALPNAVLDVWKGGYNYFCSDTWSSSKSIGNGSYTYTK